MRCAWFDSSGTLNSQNQQHHLRDEKNQAILARIWFLRGVKTSLLQFLSSSAPTQSETEGCKSWPGHLWVKGGGEVRDRGRRLSWLEDPESARFRPPSRSRLVQPCRRKAPSPPHLRTTETLRVHRVHGYTIIIIITTAAPHLGSSWWRCWRPSSSEPSQTSSPGWSCYCQWRRDPESRKDTTQTLNQITDRDRLPSSSS